MCIIGRPRWVGFFACLCAVPIETAQKLPSTLLVFEHNLGLRPNSNNMNTPAPEPSPRVDEADVILSRTGDEQELMCGLLSSMR